MNSPNGQFMSYDPNMIRAPFQSNLFPSSFIKPQHNISPPYQTPIIERNEFKNTGHVIHNNLKDTLLDEYITEYIIVLDSSMRDISLYPSPYHYSVLINQNNTNDKGGIILKELHNIKYIKVDSVILPRKWRVVDIDFDDSSDMSYEYKVSINLSNVVDNNVYSNDQQLTKKSTLLYCDKKFEEAFFKLVSLTQGNEYIYDNNNLGRLDKLDIHIQIGDYNTNDVNSIGIDPQSKNKNDLNHPLNKFRQNLVILRIGILENSMAKLNFN